MKIKLTNQAHIQYAKTDNACQAFRKAVANGQARLALEMMVDIVDFIESLAVSEDEDVITESNLEPDLIKYEEEQPKSTPAKRTPAKRTAKKAAPKETIKEEEPSPEED